MAIHFRLEKLDDSNYVATSDKFEQVLADFTRNDDGTWATKPQFIWVDADTNVKFKDQPTVEAAFDAFVAWGNDNPIRA
ncbi:hypothetical protein [Herbiconiux sp. YIM B11900]|uniref:hypothetical protein n=1 Tax=Herbiconiux sp. YIM B11900 TaxID=3404131 RepID=UPI003F844DD3